MSPGKASVDGKQRVVIYYDGACPLCRSYTRMLRLRENVGSVDLIDLREDPESVMRFARSGLDVNEGFVVEIDGHTYHGDAAIHALAILSSPRGLFSRLTSYVFSKPHVSRHLYPWLVRGRGALLRILGRPPIALE